MKLDVGGIGRGVEGVVGQPGGLFAVADDTGMAVTEM